jgi:hypothetical protein
VSRMVLDTLITGRREAYAWRGWQRLPMTILFVQVADKGRALLSHMTAPFASPPNNENRRMMHGSASCQLHAIRTFSLSFQATVGVHGSR